MGKAELVGGQGELGSADDVLDKLPADPFGMDTNPAFTITSWIQDFCWGSGSNYCEFGVGGADDEEEETVENWSWNDPLVPCPKNGNLKFNLPHGSGGIDIGLPDGDFDSEGNVSKWVVLCGDPVEGENCGGSGDHGDDGGEGGDPHDAFYFALSYLGVEDLLAVELVCTSLRDAVRTDSLLWRRLHIDQALCDRVTDDTLVKLASRAQGTLQCLCMPGCFKVTNNGLKTVLESNPRLTKLSVPGCLSLSVDDMLLNLKAFKSSGALGLKQLRIGGVKCLVDGSFEELKLLLGVDEHMQPKSHKSQFYYKGNLYFPCGDDDEDDRAIDIEKCPRCQRVSLVYDCPRGKHHADQICRACILCIARCFRCGCCVEDRPYEETFLLDLVCLDCLNEGFCLDVLCLDCWYQRPKCGENTDGKGCTSNHAKPTCCQRSMNRPCANG